VPQHQFVRLPACDWPCVALRSSLPRPRERSFTWPPVTSGDYAIFRPDVTIGHPRASPEVRIRNFLTAKSKKRQLPVTAYSDAGISRDYGTSSSSSSSSSQVFLEWPKQQRHHEDHYIRRPIWRSLGQGQGHRGYRKGKKFPFPQCKTSIDNNSRSKTELWYIYVCMQHGVFGYVGSNGVTAIFVTWPEMTRPN